jgi:RNA 3'-phosphate cyclase
MFELNALEPISLMLGKSFQGSTQSRLDEGKRMIEIDGSQGEGGGQMLRTAVALSALTGNEVLVHGIRSKRDNPGLQPQHLCAVNGVARICDAKVRGATVGSSELEFSPGRVKGGRHNLNVGTAGSITLVLQACMLAGAHCREDFWFEVTGGTNVRWSPPIDFYKMMFFPLLGRMGGNPSLVKFIRGFYPEGGGKVEATWHPPASFAPLAILERGELRRIQGIAFVQGLPAHIVKRMGDQARKAFIDTEIRLENQITQGPSKGAGVFLVADFVNCSLSGDYLGERGVPAETVGERAASALKDEVGSISTIDAHSADQILPYMCIAQGPSSFLVKEVTGHVATQADLVCKFLGAQVSYSELKGGTRVDVQPSRTCN